MTVRFDWYKHDPHAFLVGVQGMGPDMIGAYIVILDLIYARGGELRRDDRHLAGVMGCSKRLATSLTNRLIEAGKISCKDAVLTNFRAETELKEQRKVSERRSKAQRVRREMEAASNENNELENKHVSVKPSREEKKREDIEGSLRSPSCSEPENPPPSLIPPKVAIELLATRNETVKITFDEVREWQRDFPAVDVPQQLRAMRAWLSANPSKRKTASGMRRFVVNWLSKEQDRGGQLPVGVSVSAISRKPDVYDAFEKIAQEKGWTDEQTGSSGDFGDARGVPTIEH